MTSPLLPSPANAARTFAAGAQRRAVALVIVLAFVVLLTGLVVAFFSSTLLSRQISNSSANETKADLFAQGAVDTIVGDLKQEIAAGSNATLYTDANSKVVGRVYRPFNPSAAAPAPALKGSSSEQTGVTSYAANLVKRSAYQQNFFPAGTDSGSANYNTGNTSETISASATPSAAPPNAPAYPSSNRATNVSSTTASQNGRFVSLARWNKALLLPKAHLASDTDSTPVNPANAQDSVAGYAAPVAGANEFVAPDWVLVARDGSNPTGAFNGNMISSGAGGSVVVGRYAYAIYDEGGLLDSNVAGCPTGKNNFGVVNALYATQVAYKNALAFADLTQLPGISALAATPASNSRQAQVIQSLVGWRNYATVKPTSGTLAGANYNFGNTYATGSPWYNFVTAMQTNTNGFLSTSNPAPYNGQSDRMFASRQELLRLMLSGIAQQGNTTAAASDRANIQNALQYLGTFNRSLNQPSFLPDPARPTVRSIDTGGNDAYQAPAATVDNKINPALQTVRVSTTGWTRNDGTAPVVGEPLVKKRFTLKRLAWLSYNGPASNNLTDAVVKQTITQLGGDPANTQDAVYRFVAQGTDDGTKNTNIPKYFGLTWDDANKRWKYIHGISGSNGRIMTLAEVAAANREPDFFELIKAAVSVGTLGKAFLYTGSPDPTYPSGYQQQRDNSVDAQVMQIGANIIDQFDCDGYPTRILFSDNTLFGGVPQEYRGVEDLPYLYRLREGKVTLRDSNPKQANLPNVTDPLTDGGLAAILQQPEIWNPHGWNSTATDSGLRPTNLRIVAISTDPNSASSTPGVVSTGTTPVNVGFYCLTWSGSSFGGAVPPFHMGPATPVGWDESTTEMDFQVPLNMQYLFREPTLLVKPNIPANSNLAVGAGNIIKGVQGANYLTAQWSAPQITAVGGTDDLHYIGFLAGYGPVAWTATVPQSGIGDNNPAVATPGAVEATSAYLPTAIKGITYRMQYQHPSGKWLTYDEKFTSYLQAGSYNNGYFWTDLNKTFNAFPQNAPTQYYDDNIGVELGASCFDPRTGRFGMQFLGPNGYRAGGNSQFPVRMSVMKVGWASTDSTPSALLAAATNMALATMRPEDLAGFQFGGGGLSFLYTSPTAPGWYPVPNGNNFVQPGMFSQNNPAEAASPSSNAQVAGDGQTIGGPNNQYFADADNVVRRSMSAYVPTDTTNPATPPAAGKPSGLPMKVAFNYSTATPTTNGEIASRPIVLNRPFRSPAELGYVFSDTPWRNLDMSTPESGAVALMDVFCVNDTNDANGMVAGKVNLNTRQAPVLTSILGGASSTAGTYSGAYKDEFNPATATTAPTPAPNITATDASNIGGALIARTSSTAAGKGPLTNLSELAGKWNSSVAISNAVNGSQSYSGFSDADLGAALALNGTSGASEQRVSRFREAAIRPLASVGQTRTWNLMIDLVAQTGRYPTSAGSATNPLAAFIVEGEQRYWIHVAIDRWTGNVIDKQVEVVKE